MVPMAKRSNLSHSSRSTSGPAKADASLRPSWATLPPRAYAGAGWALLPLRAFLGFTFVFAGLQKFANPNFFNSASPDSINAQLIAADRNSPLSFLLGHLIEKATAVGILMALGELAVGLGILFGLWTRVAAIAGSVISLSLFLSVSFHQHPYYTGSDIVFAFAFVPLAIAGAGVLSLDSAIAARVRRDKDAGDPTIVPIEFGSVQEHCGNFVQGRCSAQANAACSPSSCPVLVGSRAPLLARRAVDEIDRRTAVAGGMAAGATAVAVVISAGAAAGLGRAVGGVKGPVGGGTSQLRPGSTTTPQTPTTSGGTSTTTKTSLGHAIGPSTSVKVGGAATFSNPLSQQTGIVIQPTAGDFRAFDALCPHAGCVVSYSKPADLLVCPCHGSQFNAKSGVVEVGPAVTGLKEYKLAVGSDGQLYISA